ncbi:hypothetical protein H310_09930 [Aphanomyces invadans]|uniref:Uncharacterized protein n=1 Tax=Aphanomyces invadans TaxID=157072 RepID=A0A024TSY2_9STRA|nr:hypothetical protein H310_09930 [Aphanomyces invadans]ETV97124.1 hypothetical protein H310_09930 [Aphanomyces invadans]RHY26486.1 hypothetical protein DYB32_007567 [Aphanomyces invadans]|eukprot:XP_008874370.1 hypothetical protein H310_09930 [Aphanomyces invadans]
MSDVGLVNETSILGGNSTGNGTVFGLPLNLVETERGWCLFVSFLAALVASGLTLCNMYLHLRAYTRPNLQRYILRILIIVPFYAIGSFLSFWLVHQAIYFNILRDIYEAFVVYSFLELVLSFAGGESNCVSKMVGEKELDHPFPCNFCFPPMARDGRLLRACKKATIQFVFIKPTIALLSLFMLAIDEYNSTGYQWFLWVVYNGSYSIALYGLLVFYLATKHILAPFSPVLKFFAVKSVIFMTFWQSLMIASCPDITVEQAFAWNDFILCVEMVPVAILYLISFGARQFQLSHRLASHDVDKEDGMSQRSAIECGEATPHSGEVVRNMKEVLNVKDIVADAFHNFSSSYQDYMLQRADDEDLEKAEQPTSSILDAPTPTTDDGSPHLKTNQVNADAAAPKPDHPGDQLDDGIDVSENEHNDEQTEDGVDTDGVIVSPSTVAKRKLSPKMATYSMRKASIGSNSSSNSSHSADTRTRRSSAEEMPVRQEAIAIPYSMSDEEEDETLLVSPRKNDKTSLLK